MAPQRVPKPDDSLTLNGQVFIATQGGENIKLALVHVHLYSLEQVQAFKQENDRQSDSLSKEVATQKQQCINDVTKLSANPTDSAALEAKSHDLDQYQAILYKSYNLLSPDSISQALPTPVADEQTDSDGKFSMSVPKTGAWFLEAIGQRSVGNQTENYFWLFNVSGDMKTKGQVFLSNDNLATKSFPSYEGDVLLVMDTGTIGDIVKREIASLDK